MIDSFRDKGGSASAQKADQFWEREIGRLSSEYEVVIPKRNYDELVKLSERNGEKALNDDAKRALKRINSLYKGGKLSIVGDPNDPFADAILLSVALKFKMQRNMLFVTQDHALAEDLEAIRHFESLADHKKYDKYDIAIKRVSASGSLEPWRGLDAKLAKRYRVSDGRASLSSSAATKRVGFFERSRKTTSQPIQSAKRAWWSADEIK